MNASPLVGVAADFEQLRQRGLEAHFGGSGLEQVGAAQAGRQAFLLDRIPLGLLPLVVGDPLNLDPGNALPMVGPVGGVTFSCLLSNLGEALIGAGRVEPVNDEEPSSRWLALQVK